MGHSHPGWSGVLVIGVRHKNSALSDIGEQEREENTLAFLLFKKLIGV